VILCSPHNPGGQVWTAEELRGLAEFARRHDLILGVFRLGGTLVGTAAYALYQGELGVRFDNEELAQTGDIDLASFERLSVALADTVDETPGDILQALQFDPVPGLQDRQVWKWRQTRGAVMVEFLTPAFGQETVKPLPALGVSAQGLNYLNFQIAQPYAPAEFLVLEHVPILSPKWNNEARPCDANRRAIRGERTAGYLGSSPVR
jgi:hypothetical protein